MQRTARPARYGAGMAHALKLHVMNVALGQTVGGAIIRAMQAAALEQRGRALLFFFSLTANAFGNQIRFDNTAQLNSSFSMRAMYLLV